jgi:xanthine dehydrogenase YagS FAD-binding subunit
VKPFAYARPAAIEEAAAALERPDARAMGGGTDLLTQQQRGIRPAESVIDLRGLGLEAIDDTGEGGALRIGATATLAAVGRHEGIAERFAVLHEAARAAASPQLREMGTVAGNLCQAVRCWYYRHPDLTCWLRGGDTCYAQIGDHRKHGLEPGDCISVAPSDLAAALLALDAAVSTNRRETFPLAELYRKATGDDRSTIALEPGEGVTGVTVPRSPRASAYLRTGERAAWSFALVAVAAARFDDGMRMAAIGVSNLPRLLDAADPLAGLPGLEMTGWKRRLLHGLAGEAARAVAA